MKSVMAQTGWEEPTGRDHTWRGEAVVWGPPGSQGSKRAFVVKGKARMIEDSARSRPWRDSMIAAMRDCRPERPFDEPMQFLLFVYVNRPSSQYGTGRNSGVLKPNAPGWPKTGLDLDKVQRSVGDAAMAAGWVRDDSRIVSWLAGRYYVDHDAGEVERTVVEAFSIDGAAR